jgi:hypothetical protein
MKKDKLCSAEQNLPQPGKKDCLRCHKQFDSWDVKKNWICPMCTKLNSHEYIPKRHSSYIHNKDNDCGANIDHDA